MLARQLARQAPRLLLTAHAQNSLAVCAAVQLQQERGMKLFEIFSKEARAERKRKLKEEIERGYFDDFREFRDTQGKVFMAQERLTPAAQAATFPRIHPLQPDGTAVNFPPTAAAASTSADTALGSSSGSSEGGSSGSTAVEAAPVSLPAAESASAAMASPGEAGAAAAPAAAAAAAAAVGAPAVTLVCIGFRAGSQEMLEGWAQPYAERFAAEASGPAPAAALVELSLVESLVMGAWPFKQLLVKEGAKGEGKYAMPASFLFHFGNTDELRSTLHMTNRLTCYVYLVDAAGLVRWRGSGAPQAQELQSLLRCAGELLKQQR